MSGVTLGGAGVFPAINEYEVCFKCHADFNSSVYLGVSRVIFETNTRLEFDTLNPSYHPVAATGKNPTVPSLSPPSLDPEAPQSLNVTSIIYCTDCHSDDSGSRGPHGSSYSPILKRRYEILDGTSESYQNYDLCYRCHNRTSILNDDSFRKGISGRGGHSGHLAAGATCSACHDPHGVKDDFATGSHTHLINFDTLIVSPLGNPTPTFNDLGTSTGSCNLTCHGCPYDFSYWYSATNPATTHAYLVLMWQLLCNTTREKQKWLIQSSSGDVFDVCLNCILLSGRQKIEKW
jgi:hypothetical protein